MKGKVKAEGGLAAVQAQGGILGTPAVNSGADASLYDDVLGVKLKNTQFDIPVVYNEEVEKWLRFFTERGRDHFAIYLERMSAMGPVIRPMLQEAGMPEDLVYLCMIESGFSTRAKSHANAVGPWQFIKSTGQIYDLKVDWWQDQRRDPVKSTQAAIRYLRDLHEEFGSWELATAAYNSGEVRIRNAIQRLGTQDFWAIARDRRALRRETRDYVPKMMAAAILAKNAELYGFQSYEEKATWANTAKIKIDQVEDLRTLARLGGVSAQDLKELNPEIARCCTPPSRNGYFLRVPKEVEGQISLAISNKALGNYDGFVRHKVKQGDSYSRISKRYRVPQEIVAELNGPAAALAPGKELLIPGPTVEFADTREPRILGVSRKHRRYHRRSSIGDDTRTVATAAVGKDGKTLIYTVRQGDTLYDISRRYAVSVNDIKDWNEISRSRRLKPGKQLKLFVRNDRI